MTALATPSPALLAIPYSRVSSSSQTGGLGLERQEASPADYCKARSWKLWDGPAYSDAGVSAYGGQNLREGDLARFLADVRDGRFGADPLALLIEDVDRFSRAFPLSILSVVTDDLLNAGVTIALMSKGRDFDIESIRRNPFELHELLFMLGASHAFSDRLSKRLTHVHQVRREKVRNGEVVAAGLAPSWLELDEKGQWRFTPYAAVIRRVLKMAETMGCAVIAQRLNGEGVPCPGEVMRQRQKPSRSGKPPRPLSWNSASVRQLIVHPSVIGSRNVVTPGHLEEMRAWREKCEQLKRQKVKDLPPRPKRTYLPPQPSYYPALLSEAEQAALVAGMERRRTSTQGRIDQLRWIAQGFTTCAACGAPIGASGGRVKLGRRVIQLRCKGAAKGLGCQSPSMALLPAQAALLTRITEASFALLFKDEASGAKLAPALTRLAAAQKEADQLMAQAAAGEAALENESDAAVVAVLAKRQAALGAKAAAARKRLLAAQSEVDQLQRGPGTGQLVEGVQGEVRALLQKFARQEDEVDDRRMVRTHLERLGLRVVIDASASRLALQVGEGPPQWQPIHADLAQAQLEAGRAGVSYAGLHIPAAAIREAHQQWIAAGSPADGEIELPITVTDGDVDSQSDCAMIVIPTAPTA